MAASSFGQPVGQELRGQLESSFQGRLESGSCASHFQPEAAATCRTVSLKRTSLSGKQQVSNKLIGNPTGQQFNGIRERLFRLLSKVPIQVESEKLAGSSKQVCQSSPLVIKYYQERALASILELHFACSLVGTHQHQHHHHHRESLQAASLPSDWSSSSSSSYHSGVASTQQCYESPSGWPNMELEQAFCSGGAAEQQQAWSPAQQQQQRQHINSSALVAPLYAHQKPTVTTAAANNINNIKDDNDHDEEEQQQQVNGRRSSSSSSRGRDNQDDHNDNQDDETRNSQRSVQATTNSSSNMATGVKSNSSPPTCPSRRARRPSQNGGGRNRAKMAVYLQPEPYFGQPPFAGNLLQANAEPVQEAAYSAASSQPDPFAYQTGAHQSSYTLLADYNSVAGQQQQQQFAFDPTSCYQQQATSWQQLPEPEQSSHMIEQQPAAHQLDVANQQHQVYLAPTPTQYAANALFYQNGHSIVAPTSATTDHTAANGGCLQFRPFEQVPQYYEQVELAFAPAHELVPPSSAPVSGPLVCATEPVQLGATNTAPGGSSSCQFGQP